MGKYTEQQHQNVLQNLSTENRIRAMRKLAAAPQRTCNQRATRGGLWSLIPLRQPYRTSQRDALVRPKGHTSRAAIGVMRSMTS